ncbi:MAG: aldo/keto reductase [Elusimicrobia bacterium]|nr:aldo/keto reductase [Candidatus Obscuribacterium magneticum]
MIDRPFGRTKERVSEVGFGAWGIGRAWWGPTKDKESLAALAEAWSAGINFYDTAFVYGDGHSEALVGRALQGKEAFIATKIPPRNWQWPATPQMPLRDAFPSEWITSCTERSLKKLNRDCVDLTQFHVWTDAWLGEDEWKKAVETLKEQGKIRFFGVSINDHDPDSALELVASGLVDSVQVIFNIFDQSPKKKLFPLCRTHNVAVIARVPFDEGSLTGTLTLETTFEGDDFRRHYFKGDNLKAAVERVEKLKGFLGPETGVSTLPELALRFILAHEEVSVVIPGMRRHEHVRQNVAVSDGKKLGSGLLTALASHAWNRNFYKGWE